jgi:uncharacterized protein (DUF1810 family)
MKRGGEATPARFDLERFVKAQDGHPGFAEAIGELRAGAKRSHWIWYVFPQLRGLGSSPMAVRYGLDGVEEAAAYLEDRRLRTRLALATELVANQVGAGIPLDVLMGGEIDVRKLVSSMTLFGPLARAEHGRGPFPEEVVVGSSAEEILAAAMTLGVPRCPFTEERVRASVRR